MAEFAARRGTATSLNPPSILAPGFADLLEEEREWAGGDEEATPGR